MCTFNSVSPDPPNEDICWSRSLCGSERCDVVIGVSIACKLSESLINARIYSMLPTVRQCNAPAWAAVLTFDASSARRPLCIFIDDSMEEIAFVG